MARPPRLRIWFAAAALGAVVFGTAALAGCTGTAPPAPSTAAPSSTTTTASTPTSVSPTPVTPNGMVTGPGVTTATITLGVLADPSRDAGFSVGATLWVGTTNSAGGICGRTIELDTPVITTGSAGLGHGYAEIGRQVLGFMALPGRNDAAALREPAATDQIPVLTPTGTSGDLGPRGLTVVGPTEAIQVINGLAYLASEKIVTKGGHVVILGDGSATAQDGLAGARWWAAKADMTLEERPVSDTAGLSGAVLVLAGPTVTSAVLRADAHATVLTTLDGLPETAEPETAKRLLVSTPAPAFGSGYPQSKAIQDALHANGVTMPGPRFLSGYATAATWGRLLTQACTALALTRAGIAAAITKVGPAPVDSLFGPSDPALPGKGEPATRVSAMARADPASPGGLLGLTWLQGAPGIADYPGQG